MPAAKPDPRRSPTPYALNVRLTKAQYAHLLIRADRAGSMGAALRAILDEAIDTTVVYTGPDEHDIPTNANWRSILENVDLDHLDPDEVARLLVDDDTP